MSRRQFLALVATILGSTVVFLDSTVVNVALPAIAEGLDADLAGQQWVVEAYMLTLVSLLLVGGSLGDQLGRRRVFVVGLVAFGAWTAWTGIATVLGPAGGGALVEALSWRAIFWVNIPLIAVTVALTLNAVRESHDPEAFRGIDWLGIGLSAAGFAGAVFALIEQPSNGWGDPLVWAPMVASSAGSG